MPQLEAFEKVFISNPEFVSSIHNSNGCEFCHGGNTADYTKEGAHENLIKYPSLHADSVCTPCHSNIVGGDSTSIHSTLSGYTNMISIRSGGMFDPNNIAYKDKFEQQCTKCHTTCGQCHVSRPVSVESGFIDGHTFKASPSTMYNCTACHGSRVGEEYLGQREGYKADVHWNPYGMQCTACHTGEEMHASGSNYEKRYDVAEMPRCEDCHSDVATANDYHTQHWDEIQCQVCHSQKYKNCYNCHAGTGLEEPSILDFKIGRNPLPTLRDYDYVVVRHVPVDPTTFEDWGLALPDFDLLPTWKYSSPHNIRLITPQTDTTGVGNCYGNCHGVSGLYLKLEDLRDYEINANSEVIVPSTIYTK